MEIPFLSMGRHGVGTASHDRDCRDVDRNHDNLKSGFSQRILSANRRLADAYSGDGQFMPQRRKETSRFTRMTASTKSLSCFVELGFPSGIFLEPDDRICPNRSNRLSFILSAKRSSPDAVHGADHIRCENSCNSLTDVFALLRCLVRNSSRRRTPIACIQNKHHAPAMWIHQLVRGAVRVRRLARTRSRRVGTSAE